MSMGSSGGGGANSNINVTPLVDVCLVLLIIFMVMVPQNVNEISVRVPPTRKTTKPKPPKEEPLVIGLSADKAITLNRVPVQTKEKLGAEIKRQLEFRDKQVVFVDFHDEVDYGTAVAILELSKEAGAEVLGIMKKKGRKTPDTLE